MVFSVQQVKYEFLAYIKEFDPTFSNWYVGLADQHLKTAGAPPMEQSEDVDCVYLYKVAAHTRQ